jgi:YNFM family putative membrane transporter
MLIARGRRIAVIAAGAITFLNLYNVQALLPTLAREFALPLPRTGLAVTATLLAVALVAPFVGSVSDMLGRKRLIVSAIWGLTVPTLLCATATGLPALVAWRFVQGLLLPFIFTVTVAYIGEEMEDQAAVRLVADYSMGAISGGFAGRFLAGHAAHLAGWRASFVLLAGLTVAAALIVQTTLPPERNFRPIRGVRRTLSSFGQHLASKPMIATCAIGFGVLFSIVAAFTYAGFLLAAPPYGLSPASLGSIFVVYLFGFVSTPAATWLTVRAGRRPALAGAVLLAFSGLAITLLPSLAAIVAGLGLIAGAVFAEQSLALGFIGIAARGARSTAVGLYVTCYYVGGSLGGILPGAIWRHLGWPGCVLLVAGVQFAVAGIALACWREAPRAAGGR